MGKKKEYCSRGHLMSETRVMQKYGSICSVCKSDYNKKYEKENAERLSARQKIYKRQVRYDITQDQYDELLKIQDNKCAICKNEFVPGSNITKACVDHNHNSGEFRAILCGACNLGLGYFKDNKKLLSAAIVYLAKYEVSTHAPV